MVLKSHRTLMIEYEYELFNRNPVLKLGNLKIHQFT